MNFNEHITEYRLNVYGGQCKKKTVILDDGEQYLLKFPSPFITANSNTAYSYEPVSEYIGCRIFEEAGFPVQKTILGTFTLKSGTVRTVCACKDLCQTGEKLYEASKALFYFDETYLSSLRPALSYIDGINGAEVYKEFCRRFVIDAFIGNPKRSGDDWGFISDSGGNIRLAPVYGCGSALSPMLGEREISESGVIENIIDTAAFFKDGSGKRIPYSQLLSDSDINAALTEVFPKINMENILRIIYDIPYITDARKLFYKRLLSRRYEQLLIPALKRNCGDKKEKV